MWRVCLLFARKILFSWILLTKLINTLLFVKFRCLRIVLRNFLIHQYTFTIQNRMNSTKPLANYSRLNLNSIRFTYILKVWPAAPSQNENQSQYAKTSPYSQNNNVKSGGISNGSIYKFLSAPSCPINLWIALSLYYIHLLTYKVQHSDTP